MRSWCGRPASRRNDRRSLRVTKQSANRFDFADSAAYERFVGSWGRAAGAEFLSWLNPPVHRNWLDVGCGTGLFTELIVETRRPSVVVGIDQARAQIDYARRKPVAKLASFRVGDAQALPFDDASFDVVASALVINFIPDRLRALEEMHRVVRAGGIVAGYVWDFMSELSPSGPFRLAMKDVLGHVPPLPGAEGSGQDALRSLFESAALRDIATRTIDVQVEFASFDAFWLAQTPSYAPTTRIIAALSARDRDRLMKTTQARLLPSRNGNIRYTARANAISGRAA
jgi:ubiquinone/menaquinone biosynthesis C-methylase UbiE